MRTNLFVVLCLLCTSLPAYAGSRYYEPIRGRVVDQETGAPLAGAVVVVVYNIEKTSVGGPVTYFADVQEVLTDETGAFLVPGKKVKAEAFWPFSRFSELVDIYVVKSGYGPFPEDRGEARQAGKVGGELEYRLARVRGWEDQHRAAGWPAGVAAERIPYYTEQHNEERKRFGLSPRPVKE